MIIRSQRHNFFGARTNEIQITGCPCSVCGHRGIGVGADSHFRYLQKRCKGWLSSQSIEVGDQPGHVLVIAKTSCTWSVPAEMAGLKSTTAVQAETVDVTSAKFTDRGYVVISMENGDKVYGRFQGMGSMKEGAPTNGEGAWSFTSGTGKVKGVKGKGTWKSSGAPNGDGEFQVEGEYSLPGPSDTAKK